ncbi:MAG: DUF5685 family protein, partial [Clostridiales bacterium]|nr:DUF5685 family protein [Clostridiales bacterium]
YNAYYCAICHAVKKRYGELPRLMLSYDAVFIAMLAAGLMGEPETVSFQTFRCLNNPLKKRNETESSAGIEYAADVMVLLGWLSLKDKKEDKDQGRIKSAGISAAEALLRGAGRRAVEKLGKKARLCLECVYDQWALEIAKTDSLDRAAHPTGRLMAELLDFTDAPGISEDLSLSVEAGKEGKNGNGRKALSVPEASNILREFGYHLGRYIYIVDAVDDLEKDRKTGAYNPLLLRPETPEILKTAISLDLARVGELINRLPVKCHKSIVNNIVYFGLHAKLDEVLARLEGPDAQLPEQRLSEQ